MTMTPMMSAKPTATPMPMPPLATVDNWDLDDLEDVWAGRLVASVLAEVAEAVEIPVDRPFVLEIEPMLLCEDARDD